MTPPVGLAHRKTPPRPAPAPSTSLTWSTRSTWTPNLPPNPRTESTCEQCLDSLDWYSWPTADCNGSECGASDARPQWGRGRAAPAVLAQVPPGSHVETVLETWPERQHARRVSGSD